MVSVVRCSFFFRAVALLAFQSPDWPATRRVLELAANSSTAGSTAACKTTSNYSACNDRPFLTLRAWPRKCERFSTAPSRPALCSLFQRVLGQLLYDLLRGIGQGKASPVWSWPYSRRHPVLMAIGVRCTVQEVSKIELKM